MGDHKLPRDRGEKRLRCGGFEIPTFMPESDSSKMASISARIWRSFTIYPEGGLTRDGMCAKSYVFRRWISPEPSLPVRLQLEQTKKQAPGNKRGSGKYKHAWPTLGTRCHIVSIGGIPATTNSKESKKTKRKLLLGHPGQS